MGSEWARVALPRPHLNAWVSDHSRVYQGVDASVRRIPAHSCTGHSQGQLRRTLKRRSAMGDKGGKKDKGKAQKQKASKKEKEAKKKREKQAQRTP